jgi:hypothetical protein
VSTPLRAHRERARSQTPPASPLLNGSVVALTEDAITTSVGRDQLLDAGVRDEDVVTVRVAGQTITTRFLEPATVAAVLGSPAALDTFDVDVVCTTDARNAVVIVGRGGGLPAWLRLQPGMPVTIEKP